MGSLEEKMSESKRIIIESSDDFVIEIRHRGTVMAELNCRVKDIEYSIMTGKSNVDLSVFNPKTNRHTVYET